MMLKVVIPFGVGWRTRRGRLKVSLGAGIVINDGGCLLTAGHILQRIAKIATEAAQPSNKRSGKGPDSATHYTIIIGVPNAVVTPGRVTTDPELDLGTVKLTGYSAPAGHVYPRFRTDEVEQGELLCRGGYPFVNSIKPHWTQANGFSFTNLFPTPFFVNEALVSRFGALPSGGRWIETSSPGLGGQSGGPLVDVNSLICGIQVNTEHYPLGFRGAGRNQTLNVGRAVDVSSVRSHLDSQGIPYHT